MNCTPFVRQYGILKTNGVFYYAKREAKQEIYTGIQENGNHAGRKVVSIVFRKLVCRLWKQMRSAGNRGFLQGSLQVLHIHILFVAPLGTGYMTQPGTDQHKGGVSIWETPYHTGTAANLPVQSLNNVVGVTPKFCVKSNECRNRAKFICRRQRLDRLPPISTT